MSGGTVPISEALAKYDRAAEAFAVQAAEKERQEVISRFPIESWPTLPLERYALGQGDNTRETYCWWLEFGTPLIGSMKGGSAQKHLIYRQRDGHWHYDVQSFKNEHDAWQA